MRTSSLVNYDQNPQKYTPNISSNKDSIHEVCSPGAFKSSTSTRVQAIYRDTRDSQNNTPMGYQTSDNQKQPVHDRLLNPETKPLRSFNRRPDPTYSENRPMTYLNNVKQNAIKFTSSEADYTSFMNNNMLIANSNGGNFLDQYKK